MKSNLLANLAAAIVALIHTPSILAQDVTLKVDLVGWGPDVEGLTLKSESKGEPITARSFTYTKPVSYSGPALMTIHQVPGTPPPAGVAPGTAPIDPQLAKLREKDLSIVALAKIPTGSRRVTVLIAPSAAGTFQTVVIDDDPSKLPPGQLRVHNYSPMKIAMKCNNKAAMELKTRQSFLAPAVDEEVFYELAYDENGKWEVQENNLVRVQKDQQVQLIVLKSDDKFFTSSDGSRSGFLQTLVLRRPKETVTP